MPWSSPFSGSRLDKGGEESGELGLDRGLRKLRVIPWNENGADSEVVLTDWRDVCVLVGG